MAYQNVGTPRFYIDILQWYTAIGAGSATKPAIGLNPSSLVDIDMNETGEVPYPEFFYHFNASTKVKFNYFGILGHTNATDNYYINVDDGTFYMNNLGLEEIVNIYTTIDEDTGFANFGFEHNGFSLMKLTDLQDQAFETINIRVGTPIGCFTMGNIYEMGHAPDLKLTMAYEYDGIKSATTKGGHTLSNASYLKPADWGNMGAWQLSSTTETGQSAVPSNLRSGRRVIDLSFSFLADTDMFPVNASSGYSAYTNDGYHTDTLNPTTGVADISTTSETGGTAGAFNSNILDGTDFFSQCWNKTLAGHLPMIVQMDKDNNNPDQFMLARFDQSSLKVKQTMHRRYDVKLKIRECW